MHTRTIGNIVINAHRKWIWLLEYHTDTFTQNCCIHTICVNIFIVQFYLSCDAHTVYQIVHAVDGLQKSRLSATGWSDKSRHTIFPDVHVNIFQGMIFTIIQVQITDGYFCFFSHVILLCTGCPCVFVSTFMIKYKKGV